MPLEDCSVLELISEMKKENWTRVVDAKKTRRLAPYVHKDAEASAVKKYYVKSDQNPWPQYPVADCRGTPASFCLPLSMPGILQSPRPVGKFGVGSSSPDCSILQSPDHQASEWALKEAFRRIFGRAASRGRRQLLEPARAGSKGFQCS